MKNRQRLIVKAALGLTFAVLVFTPVASAQSATETIVFVRHGEKPLRGLGQLDCQGLNRALALPAVIAKSFGKPDAIFAPDPADHIADDGRSYDYVRPLATIEPTAILFGLPVNASLGFSDIGQLRTILEQPSNDAAFILVAWEHKQIEAISRALMLDYGGNPALIPKWHSSDFDSMYVFTIARNGNSTSISFKQKHEGLDGQSRKCPP